MSDIDQQFVEYVVKSLVGKPDAVQIERRIDEKGVLLELTVDPEDLGRVIGKRGATAQSLRTLLRALGTKNDARYNLKIIDNGPLDHGRPPREDSAPAPSSDTATDNSAVSASDDTSPAPDEEVVAAPAPSEEAEVPAEEIAEAVSDQEPEESTSDRVRQARAELADLDDLDV